MDPKVFKRLSEIAYQEAGIYLPSGKETLVASRISKRIRALGLGGEKEYLEYLNKDSTGEEMSSFLDAISTNFTSFMREDDHFEILARWAAGKAKKGKPRIRIWCAAAASGEEPYSIVITLLDLFEDKEADFRVLATDISKTALAKARRGIYPEKAVRPLTKLQRSRYFTKGRDESGETRYIVRPALKEKILFRRLNLAKPPYPLKGPLDVIFCRNVMIYFQKPTREGIVREAERLLAPGGLLVTGHSDTLTGIRSGLQTLYPSVYRKPFE